MSSEHFIILVLAVLAFSGLSNAMATCGDDAFIGSCLNCHFDSNGKMDKACWKTYEDGVKSCLAGAYPMMAGKYYFGGCPQLDTCVQRVQACKASVTTGDDSLDCHSTAVIACTKMGDICAQAANDICAEGKGEDESGFNNVSAGGTKFNDTKPANVTGYDTIETNEPFDWLCMGPALMMGCMFGGALFYKRK